mmetsp:Transcript_2217/g.4964  ORF Transcript_2217/g.4964 Transcript_2217/m.4964 type:complete len:128 (+) Transcript_2217:801-1184(+)
MLAQIQHAPLTVPLRLGRAQALQNSGQVRLHLVRQLVHILITKRAPRHLLHFLNKLPVPLQEALPHVLKKNMRGEPSGIFSFGKTSVNQALTTPPSRSLGSIWSFTRAFATSRAATAHPTCCTKAAA